MRSGKMIAVKAATLMDPILVSAFMASVPDHLYFKDLESRFVSVSTSLAQSLGCAVEEVLGKTDFDFFDEPQARSFREDELKIMCTGEALIDRVVKHTWADGRETWSLNVAMPMRSATGEIVGIFGTNKDITAARLMERELENANRELSNASIIVQNSPVILYRLRGEPSFPLIYVSHNIYQIGPQSRHPAGKPKLGEKPYLS